MHIVKKQFVDTYFLVQITVNVHQSLLVHRFKLFGCWCQSNVYMYINLGKWES